MILLGMFNNADRRFAGLGRPAPTSPLSPPAGSRPSAAAPGPARRGRQRDPAGMSPHRRGEAPQLEPEAAE